MNKIAPFLCVWDNKIATKVPVHRKGTVIAGKVMKTKSVKLKLHRREFSRRKSQDSNF